MGKSQRTDLRTALDVPEITLNNALQEVAYHAHDRLSDQPDRSRAALGNRGFAQGRSARCFRQ